MLTTDIYLKSTPSEHKRLIYLTCFRSDRYESGSDCDGQEGYTLSFRPSWPHALTHRRRSLQWFVFSLEKQHRRILWQKQKLFPFAEKTKTVRLVSLPFLASWVCSRASQVSQSIGAAMKHDLHTMFMGNRTFYAFKRRDKMLRFLRRRINSSLALLNLLIYFRCYLNLLLLLTANFIQGCFAQIFTSILISNISTTFSSSLAQLQKYTAWHSTMHEKSFVTALLIQVA